MNDLLNEAHGADLPDHSKAPPSGEYQIPAAGKTLARFVGYVETGKHDNYYQGKKNGTVLKAKLFFELLGPKHMVDDGEGGKRSTLYIEDIAVKTGEKASFRKLFLKMRGERENITNMAQMLGEGFIVEVSHAQGTGENKDKVYANIRKDGEWGVMPPIVEDPATGEVKVLSVPAPTQPYRLLIWSKPSKNQWDSLFIDGTTTKKRKNDKGVEEEVEVSKNWIQNGIIKNAIDFESSPLHDLLSGLGELNLNPEDSDGPEDGPTAEQLAEAEAEAERIAAEKAAEDKAKADAAAAAKAKADADAAAKAKAEAEAKKPVDAPVEEKKPAENVDDIFAELGIN